MLAIVEKIGPMRALIYSKALSPCRFALVPVEALPQGACEGEEVEIIVEGMATHPPVVAPSARPLNTPQIRASY